ncbi:hypothetical protein L596_010462 [Steinernema carpocapsae]|uniref:Uncharacterized protein n=1 Tax=Steinernema carpocapsae TaxID=34508 RepID=A0A4U5PID4_STECR|nr:hypothetical protein L596_010462 [Steinernema carpocapsae]
MTDHHKQSKVRMPPPCFLPSLASEQRKSKITKKKAPQEFSPAPQKLAPARTKCSFAEKAKGIADSGYFSGIPEQESSSASSEVNNNDGSSGKSTSPKEKRKTKQPKMKSEKKKSKKGFTISSAYEAVKKEEIKRPPPTISNGFSEEPEVAPPSPTISSVPDAWDEGIDTPSCGTPQNEPSEEYVKSSSGSTLSSTQFDLDEAAALIHALPTAKSDCSVPLLLPSPPHPALTSTPFASTSTYQHHQQQQYCMGCTPPPAPFSSSIWKYTPPHREGCQRASLLNGTRSRAAAVRLAEERREALEALRRRYRDRMEALISADPWRVEERERFFNWMPEINAKRLDEE